ncbi:hypothetical protein MED222_06055 [Vibrio sp. MED222]|nr:hypothetical protein MED222_06055 [Vibrio sp. MED222]
MAVLYFGRCTWWLCESLSKHGGRDG